MWYPGDPGVVPTMWGIVMDVGPEWDGAAPLVTSTGSGETGRRRCPIRELEVLEQ